MSMRTLLVDNYDSYTFNLFQLISEINGSEPLVLRNDAAEWADIDFAAFDNVVISPGPGRPQPGRDLGQTLTVLGQSELPVLGVCLGHQAIAYVAGAIVTPAPLARHGHLSRVRHSGVELFTNIPQEFVVVRYHSLCVAEPLPADLEVTARSEDGVIMGLRHRHRPQWGVQFHPESIESEYGRQLLTNFRDLSVRHGRHLPRKTPPVGTPPTVPSGLDAHQPSMGTPAPRHDDREQQFEVRIEVLDYAIDCEWAFMSLYGGNSCAFWLDSSRVEEGLSRFSFMGDAGGPLGETLSYRVDSGAVMVQPSGGQPHPVPGNIFDVLDERLARLHTSGIDLPFGLECGYVGYFGYELKQDCGSPNRHISQTPDAFWLLADRLIAVDHLEHRTYLVSLTDGTAHIERAQREWRERTAVALSSPLQNGATYGTEQASATYGTEQPRTTYGAAQAGATYGDHSERRADVTAPRGEVDVGRHLVRGRSRYLSDVEYCLDKLAAGESYEICLTDKARLPAPADDLAFYRALRRVNPAPYAAFLRLPDATIFSSSPERFLRIRADGTVESKPIKGTAPRSTDPVLDEQLRAGLADSPKTHAENLMIVDLIRNDLGRVCQIGSVSVPEYMAVESYPTVHQLVSTVRGQLRADVSPLACARACFPGGSMTGAPKLRTMEIIDSLETEARGSIQAPSATLAWAVRPISAS